MSDPIDRVWYWAPRVLALAFIGLLGLFATDVYRESLDFAHTLVALAIHLIPAAVVLLALALAWRREWIGTALFPLIAVCHLGLMRHLDWSSYAVIDGPLLLIGILFWIGWRRRTKRRPAVAAPTP